MLDHRGQLRRAAVGFAGCWLPSDDRALWALRTWLDSWPGIGRVAVGMHRRGFDLQLTQYDDRGWRAPFYTTGMEHSPTSATGTAWERTPWHAAQRAAWDALKKGRGRYTGTLRFNQTAVTPTGRKMRAQQDWIEIAVAPIITREVFEAAKAARARCAQRAGAGGGDPDARRRDRGPPRPDADHPRPAPDCRTGRTEPSQP